MIKYIWFYFQTMKTPQTFLNIEPGYPKEQTVNCVLFIVTNSINFLFMTICLALVYASYQSPETDYCDIANVHLHKKMQTNLLNIFRNGTVLLVTWLTTRVRSFRNQLMNIYQLLLQITTSTPMLLTSFGDTQASRCPWHLSG